MYIKSYEYVKLIVALLPSTLDNNNIELYVKKCQLNIKN